MQITSDPSYEIPIDPYQNDEYFQILSIALEGNAASLQTDLESQSSTWHRAAIDGDLEILQAIFQNGGDQIDINAPDGSGRTALMLAVESDQLKAATWLIDNSADIWLRDNKGELAIDKCNHNDIYSLGDAIYSRLSTASKATPEPEKGAILKITNVITRLARQTSPLGMQDLIDLNQAMRNASRLRYQDLAKHLDLIVHHSASTPLLSSAVANRHPILLKSLLELQGCNPNLSLSQSPLLTAYSTGAVDCLEVLLDNPKVNVVVPFRPERKHALELLMERVTHKTLNCELTAEDLAMARLFVNHARTTDESLLGALRPLRSLDRHLGEAKSLKQGDIRFGINSKLDQIERYRMSREYRIVARIYDLAKQEVSSDDHHEIQDLVSELELRQPGRSLQLLAPEGYSSLSIRHMAEMQSTSELTRRMQELWV